MEDDPGAERDALFLEAVGRLGPALLGVLAGFDHLQRHLHPPEIERLREALRPAADRLEAAWQAARQADHSEALAAYAQPLLASARHASRAAELFLADSPMAEGSPDPLAAVLAAGREHCRAQAAIFPLREALPAFDRYFVEAGAEPPVRFAAPTSEGPDPAGLFNASNDPDRRGGFTLFVPENYDESRAWPLVTALHGGFGHGGDFLWTWLREARARGWLVLAPTSQATTWSMLGPDRDAPALDSMLAYVEGRWNVDPDRLLLTGLSDGGTYALLHGLGEGSRYSALAPVAGVLHPGNLAAGNLERARGKRIRWLHGALDWMFPLERARQGAAALREAGAEVELIEIADLSHAYPREQNGPLLEWASGDSPGA